jgi:catechol 2,3-dioxygenase-like lactoylglutathione lyase family enzyme
MKRAVVSLLALFFCVSAKLPQKIHRPRILGIARVDLLSSMTEDACDFYATVLNPKSVWRPMSPMLGHDCKHQVGLSIPLNREQEVSLSKPPRTPPSNLIHQIVFVTDDPTAMRGYLADKGLVAGGKGATSAGPEFAVNDPEGHLIGFTAPNNLTTDSTSSNRRLIHAGFVVHDRAAEDKFYKEILGFHVYWHGGMKDDETNWVDMQVPEGTDWIEYMLKVPADADHHTLGVMNHIALGVPDIHAAQQQLIKNGWKGTEQPKIGRDGKWQLNLYDPDQTRVEFMEFTPVEKPCCSEYTGPHPRQ